MIFLERPIDSRIGAIASKQSEILEDNADLERRISEAQALIKAIPDYVAPGWRVYAVAPRVVEFREGASDRNHRRLRYVLAENGKSWEMHRLWP